MVKQRQIKNTDGRLVCIVYYEDGCWHVSIKNHRCLTMIKLSPRGELEVKNIKEKKDEKNNRKRNQLYDYQPEGCGELAQGIPE